MTAIVDATFGMGSTHIVCQDYARISTNPANVYGIVADGCSKSPDTDTGARLLTLAAEQYFQTFPEADVDMRYITGQAFQAARMFKMHAQSVDATLLCIRVQEECGFLRARATVVGDGYVVARHRQSQHLLVYEISFPSGYPFYGSYLLQKGRFESLLTEGEYGLTRLVKESTIAPDGTWKECPTPVVRENGKSTSISVSWDFSSETFDLVSVFTDGAGSFFDISNNRREHVPHQKILHELSAYKRFIGQFVQRRFSRFLKDAEKRGWVHDDDISVATVYMESALAEEVKVNGNA